MRGEFKPVFDTLKQLLRKYLTLLPLFSLCFAELLAKTEN
jgi:hypothetical protein